MQEIKSCFVCGFPSAGLKIQLKGFEFNVCSPSCGSKVKVNVCKKCGKYYLALPGKTYYCSDECATHKCPMCDGIFIDYLTVQDICTKKTCQDIAYNHICEYCNKAFYRKSLHAQYCNKTCSGNGRKMLKIAEKAIKKINLNQKIVIQKCKYCRIALGYGQKTFCNFICEYSYHIDHKKVNKSGMLSEEDSDKLFDHIGGKVELLILPRLKHVSEVFAAKDYSSVLFSESIKNKVLKHDGYKCSVCGRLESLEVHHIIPRRLGGSHDLDNLVTLCTKCHRAIETADLTHAISKCFKYAKQNIGVVDFKVKEKQGLIQTLHIVKYDLIELFQKATLLNYEDDENNLSNLLLDLIDYIEESQTNS